ncbi:MAG: hypothetical protein KDD29_08975 [Flavobacteriales bacterium]|nr:hypothetical protein [Flavobacteriales bacterium]MCB9335453.1 hypothetical protein [Flavobacteriales bacterium]
MEDLNLKWEKVQQLVKQKFDEELDLQSILFVIGLQELGQNHQMLKKEQKVEVMHIGICSVLAPFGYYKKLGLDNDGWPHFKNIKKLPNDLVGESQQELLKKAIVQYFGV